MSKTNSKTIDQRMKKKPYTKTKKPEVMPTIISFAVKKYMNDVLFSTCRWTKQ